mmetsp:Transcript_28977/g.91468  ORF Transcript_28977/g.91468 Transcript_28977/m.91468 type:complete len:217 (-) Transcript_28977:399-1049(-)
MHPPLQERAGRVGLVVSTPAAPLLAGPVEAGALVARAEGGRSRAPGSGYGLARRLSGPAPEWRLRCLLGSGHRVAGQVGGPERWAEAVPEDRVPPDRERGAGLGRGSAQQRSCRPPGPPGRGGVPLQVRGLHGRPWRRCRCHGPTGPARRRVPCLSDLLLPLGAHWPSGGAERAREGQRRERDGVLPGGGRAARDVPCGLAHASGPELQVQRHPLR